MKLGLIRVFCLKLVELLLCSIIPSVIITLLNVRAYWESHVLIAIAMSIGAAFFFAYNIFAQRSYYVSVFGDKLSYCFTFVPYIVFALLTLLLYKYKYNTYVWLFSITKFLRYLIENCDDKTAILIFHSFGIIMMLFSPLGLKNKINEIKSLMDYDIRERMAEHEENE